MLALEAHTSSLEVLHVSSPIPSGIGELFHALSQSSGSGEVIILGACMVSSGTLTLDAADKTGFSQFGRCVYALVQIAVFSESLACGFGL